MKLSVRLLLVAAMALSLTAADKKFFPYPWETEVLPNGLRVVTIPTSDPELVALFTVVRTGSRNEIEPGKSGYAHLFEHMMFRGSEKFSAEQRDAILKKAGAHNNAYTTDDRTVYHILFSKSDLNAVLELEADRFQRLKYTQDVYKTETRAVLGEYNKNFADPGNKLEEIIRETAFDKHTYHHDTMGFIADIEDMPNQFDYSWKFYNRFYRPENTTILLVGDVKHAQSLELIKKYFGNWKQGDPIPAIPEEPPQTAPRVKHVDWDSPTLPLISIGFRGPAFSDELPDKPALDLLLNIAFGENSEIYRKLVLKEQKVETLGGYSENRMDPELIRLDARVKEVAQVAAVQAELLAVCEKFKTSDVPRKTLDEARSRMRYGTALGWTSAGAIAGYVAPFLGLRDTPETINKLFRTYAQLTPADLRAAANKYFQENSRTIVTLSAKPAPAPAK